MSRAVEPEEEAVWLEAHDFSSVLDAIAGNPSVRLTFDDGNYSDVEFALGELTRRGLQATFFVVAGRIGAPGFLSKTDLLQLVDAGMNVGSHGYRHRSWRQTTDDELAEELVTARDAIADATGRPVTEAACPFGAYDARVLRALRLAGYSRVFTSDGGAARPDSWLQPRTTLSRGSNASSVARILRERSGADAVRFAKRFVKAHR
ncbi:MAG TPA: polysaccharide deacetylase family protein [Thermoleophilaceae bacterium]|nr:polysaccharide deacetylase family protein [Thermoleophilaceae bacterium]